MKTSYCLLGLSLLVSSTALAQVPRLESLQALQWSQRVILVWPSSAEESIVSEFEQERVYLLDRDIVWFVMTSPQPVTNYSGELSEDFAQNMAEQYPATKAKVWLIGKDGGVKQARRVLNFDALYDQIDAMPMRQMEMQSR